MKLPDALKKEYTFPFLGGADLSRESDIPRIIREFSLRERIIFWALFWISIASVLGILTRVNGSVSSIVPVHGGGISEGIVGSPRFVNPLLAVSEADKDLVALLYSGLLRVGESGNLIPDLAESYSVSPDGLTYTFTLRPGLIWHDGVPITADDVVFTIKKITDPLVKSSRRASWEGVVVQKIDERTVEFSLKQPYSPFPENATLGIIPKHIWGTISAEEFGVSTFNISPVGGGPYKVEGIVRNEVGVPEYYDLKSFEHFALGEPFIDRIRLRFYPNETTLENAFRNGAFELVGGLSPNSALMKEERASRIIEFPLTRVFGVFFNQDHARIFTSLAVRRALRDALSTGGIVEEVLSGYGSPIEGPIPPGALGYISGIRAVAAATASTTNPLELAALSLIEDGWKRNPSDNIFTKTEKKNEEKLSFHLATADVPELKAVAEIVKETWERLGAQVEIRVFETGDLNQNIIRQRDYDALLFGEIIGRDPDPFAFWHSSQRLDPGLNVALYANVTVDKLLENARKTENRAERERMYKEFQETVEKDIPAIFLYAPNFLYIIPERVKGISPVALTVQSERYLNVYAWHLYTESIWPIFNHPISKDPHREN